MGTALLEKKNAPIKKEKWCSPRCWSYELILTREQWKELHPRWLEVSDQCRIAANATWVAWYIWHQKQGTPEVLRKNYLQYKKWITGNPKTRGPKPPGDKIELFPPSPEYYGFVSQAAPGLNKRCIALTMGPITGNITSKNATNQPIKLWKSILLNRQQLPSYTKSQPVPIDKANAPKSDGSFIVATNTDCKYYQMRARIDRIAQDGKRGVSTLDTVNILCKDRGGREVLERVTTGQYRLGASSIVYSSSKNKWFLQVVWQAPWKEPLKLDPTKWAILYPRRNRPWTLWIDGKFRKVGGKGTSVARSRIKRNKTHSTREDSYNHASSARKGHGRKHVNRWRGSAHIQKKWLRYVKNRNQNLAKEAVELCKSLGVGTIVYVQPENQFAKNQFLSSQGRTDPKDKTSWDWFQVGTLLGNKATEPGVGIEVIVHKLLGKRDPRLKKPERQVRKTFKRK